MWRIVSRSRLVARRFSSIQTSKVQPPSPPLYRNHRFFSQSPGNPNEESFVSSGTRLPSAESGEPNDTQIVGSSSNINGKSDHSDARLVDSEDLQIDGSGPGALGFAGGEGDFQLEDHAHGDQGNVTSEEPGEDSGNLLADIDGEKVYEIDAEKLEAVLTLLLSKVDGSSLKSSLDEMDIDIHHDFVMRVLETPNISGKNLFGFVKWAVESKGFRVITSVMDGLLLPICTNNRRIDAYKLWDLAKEVNKKEIGILNLDVLNELIALFSKLGKGKAALEVFDSFGEFGVSPNAKTFYITTEALFKRSFIDWAWSVCEKMLDAGMLPESEQVGDIVNWLCKEGKVKEAHLVYTFAKEKNRSPPFTRVSALIVSLATKDETVNLAQEMLGDISGEARKQAIKPFSSVINGLCRTKKVSEAKALLLDMISNGPPPGNAVFNSVINSYAKSGDLNEAKELVKLLKTRGLKPDVFTYTVIISGYVKGGLMEEASKVFAEAKKKHPKLNPATYHSLIRGYCKIEEYEKALKLLSEMEGSGVQPNSDEYGKLIQSLCLKALDWETAEKLHEEMKAKGLHLNAITRGLIRATKDLETEMIENDNTLIAEA